MCSFGPCTCPQQYQEVEKISVDICRNEAKVSLKDCIEIKLFSYEVREFFRPELVKTE